MASTDVTHRVGYILKQAQHGLRAQMDQKLGSLGLSTAQYALLTALREAEGASGADLARRCFITPQTVTGLIGGLVQSGLIVRSPSQRHGRVIEVRLTPLGRDRLRQASGIVREIEEDMLADLSVPDRAELTRMLQLCVSRLTAASTAARVNRSRS